ncbi:hypothetical protein MFRU_012g00270 [Monilinia fructicola]|nr:hypothetical protein MFRU_012g00270 [Monilinia fructicola]
MSSNDQPPATPGLDQSSVNQLENRDTHNPVSTTLSMSTALTDQNSSLVAQSSSALAVIGDLTTFTLFPDLPKECRLMIWGFAVPTHQRHRITNNEMRHNTSHSRESATILYVNSESRKEALRYLKLLFGGTNMIGSPIYKYFNPTSDSIYFDASPKKFQFSLGPHYPEGPGTNMLEGTSCLEPMQECDNISHIVVLESFVQGFGPSPYFRNLERVTSISHFSHSPDFPSDQEGRRRFVRRMFILYATKIFRGRAWFLRRLEEGLVSRVPHINIVFTRVDLATIKSTGLYGEIYFGKNLKYLNQ